MKEGYLISVEQRQDVRLCERVSGTRGYMTGPLSATIEIGGEMELSALLLAFLREHVPDFPDYVTANRVTLELKLSNPRRRTE